MQSFGEQFQLERSILGQTLKMAKWRQRHGTIKQNASSQAINSVLLHIKKALRIKLINIQKVNGINNFCRGKQECCFKVQLEHLLANCSKCGRVHFILKSEKIRFRHWVVFKARWEKKRTRCCFIITDNSQFIPLVQCICGETRFASEPHFCPSGNERTIQQSCTFCPVRPLSIPKVSLCYCHHR